MNTKKLKKSLKHEGRKQTTKDQQQNKRGVKALEKLLEAAAGNA